MGKTFKDRGDWNNSGDSGKHDYRRQLRELEQVEIDPDYWDAYYYDEVDEDMPDGITDIWDPEFEVEDNG